MKKKKSKANYGYIEFIDKHIRDNSGKQIKIVQLADVLAVSDRNIQKHIRNLEANRQIKRIQQYNEKQLAKGKHIRIYRCGHSAIRK